jgi:hypothetical protein
MGINIVREVVESKVSGEERICKWRYRSGRWSGLNYLNLQLQSCLALLARASKLRLQPFSLRLKKFSNQTETVNKHLKTVYNRYQRVS